MREIDGVEGMSRRLIGVKRRQEGEREGGIRVEELEREMTERGE